MSWSFRGLSFERVLQGDDPRWFPAEVATSTDVIAGDPAAVPRRFVDVGAVEHDLLRITAAVTSAASRDTLEGWRGQTGALVRPGGRSATALLRRADPIARQGGSYYQILLVFELVS